MRWKSTRLTRPIHINAGAKQMSVESSRVGTVLAAGGVNTLEEQGSVSFFMLIVRVRPIGRDRRARMRNVSHFRRHVLRESSVSFHVASAPRLEAGGFIRKALGWALDAACGACFRGGPLAHLTRSGYVWVHFDGDPGERRNLGMHESCSGLGKHASVDPWLAGCDCHE